MTVTTALVSGNEPLPWLAEQAASDAMQKSGLTHATGALLFLTHEFARHAQQAVTAVARTAQCTQVAGGIASGVFNEAGWVVDRPAAAVMVFGGHLSLGLPGRGKEEAQPFLSYAGGQFPSEWSTSGTRFGACFNDSFSGAVTDDARHPESLVWQQSRLNDHRRCSVQVLGAHVDIAVSCGLRLISGPQPVEQYNGFDLERLGGQPATRSLLRALTSDQKTSLARQLHHLVAIVLEANEEPERAFADGCYRPVALIAANPDQSLTLAERVKPGERICWAVRRPDSAEADMRDTLDRLMAKRSTGAAPACALMFSCIGRGPYFYGEGDRDLELLCRRFPGLPVLGTYSTGQIAPSSCGNAMSNRLLQNSVVTALVSPANKEAHVQSIT